MTNYIEHEPFSIKEDSTYLMHQYFDYLALQSFSTEKRQFTKNSSNSGFYFQQFLSWTLEEFQTDFPEIKFDITLKKQLLTELLLQSLCFLSTATSKHIAGKAPFWDSIPEAIDIEPLKDCNNAEVFYKKADNDTLDDFITKLKLSKDLKFCPKMVRVSETGDIIIDEPSYEILKSDTIISETPLSEYLFTHMLTSNIKPLSGVKSNSFTDKENIPDEKMRFLYTHALYPNSAYNPFDDVKNDEKLTKNVKYIFKKESKNFFAYIVKSINGNIIVPYTTDALTGVPFASLKSFWESTYNAYQYYHCQSSSRSDKLEDLLFLANAENIFHLTYTEKVFQKYNKIFLNLKEKAVYGFEASLALIRELQNCPLQTLSCALLDVNFDKYFKRQNFPDVARPEIYRDIYTPTMEKMTNYFFSILLTSYGCIMPIEESHLFSHITTEDNYNNEHTIPGVDIPGTPKIALKNMENLKQIILDYLMVGSNVDFSWSILENKNKPDFEKIISDDYFNFCVSFALFAPPDKFNDPTVINRSEFDISNYLKYVIERKDF